MSPICSNFYLGEMMRQTADETLWVEVCISGEHLNNLRFADGMVPITTLPERLQPLMNEVDDVSKEFQLQIITSETKIMTTIKERQQLLIRCGGQLPAQVDKFKYLESLIEQKADCYCEIRA